jgi:hypothetical protein
LIANSRPGCKDKEISINPNGKTKDPLYGDYPLSVDEAKDLAASIENAIEKAEENQEKRETILDRGVHNNQKVTLNIDGGGVCANVIGCNFKRNEVTVALVLPASLVSEWEE